MKQEQINGHVIRESSNYKITPSGREHSYYCSEETCDIDESTYESAIKAAENTNCPANKIERDYE